METKSRLYIDEVILNNYRAYHGNHSIKLSNDADKPITIIHGGNAHGKTTFLKSILWALYGKERTNIRNTDSTEGIVNKELLSSLKENETATASATIWIHDDDGPLYHLKRSITATKTDNMSDMKFDSINKSRVPTGIKFESSLVYQVRNRDDEMETINHDDTIENKIQTMFPEALSSYVFFDAELLSQFIEKKEEELIKEGIEKISDLPVIDNAVDHLIKTKKYFEKQLGETDIGLKQLLKTEERYQNNLDERSSTLEEQNKKLLDLDKKEIEISEYLMTHSADKVEEKEKNRIKLLSDKKSYNTDYANVDNEIKELLFSSINKLFLKDAINKSESKFQQYQNEGKIPPVITKVALDELLDDIHSKCICGRSLDVGSDERHRIEQMREKIIDSVLIQEISSGRDKLNRMLSSIDPNILEEQLKKLIERRRTIDEKLMHVKDSITAINDFMRNHSVEDIRNYGTKRSEVKHDILKISGAKGENEGHIQYLKSELKKLRQQIEAKESVDEKNKSTILKSKLCDIAANILKNNREYLLEEFKIKVTEIASDFFLKIAPRKNDFQGVTILPNFQMRGLDHSGNVKELSEGQRHCLGLAYITAIRHITKQNYFLMIDSPFHNIDQSSKSHIAKVLPKQLIGTQVTLLVTDQEYTGTADENIQGAKLPSVRSILMNDDNVWKEYILEDVDNNGNTRTNVKIIGDVK